MIKTVLYTDTTEINWNCFTCMEYNVVKRSKGIYFKHM